jgi:hypothetical protein
LSDEAGSVLFDAAGVAVSAGEGGGATAPALDSCKRQREAHETQNWATNHHPEDGDNYLEREVQGQPDAFGDTKSIRASCLLNISTVGS